MALTLTTNLPMNQTLFLFPFYGSDTWGWEALVFLPKVTPEQVSHRGGTYTQVG